MNIRRPNCEGGRHQVISFGSNEDSPCCIVPNPYQQSNRSTNFGANLMKPINHDSLEYKFQTFLEKVHIRDKVNSVQEVLISIESMLMTILSHENTELYNQLLQDYIQNTNRSARFKGNNLVAVKKLNIQADRLFEYFNSYFESKDYKNMTFGSMENLHKLQQESSKQLLKMPTGSIKTSFKTQDNMNSYSQLNNFLLTNPGSYNNNSIQSSFRSASYRSMLSSEPIKFEEIEQANQAVELLTRECQELQNIVKEQQKGIEQLRLQASKVFGNSAQSSQAYDLEQTIKSLQQELRQQQKDNQIKNKAICRAETIIERLNKELNSRADDLGSDLELKNTQITELQATLYKLQNENKDLQNQFDEKAQELEEVEQNAQDLIDEAQKDAQECIQYFKQLSEWNQTQSQQKPRNNGQSKLINNYTQDFKNRKNIQIEDMWSSMAGDTKRNSASPYNGGLGMSQPSLPNLIRRYPDQGIVLTPNNNTTIKFDENGQDQFDGSEPFVNMLSITKFTQEQAGVRIQLALESLSKAYNELSLTRKGVKEFINVFQESQNSRLENFKVLAFDYLSKVQTLNQDNQIIQDALKVSQDRTKELKLITLEQQECIKDQKKMLEKSTEQIRTLQAQGTQLNNDRNAQVSSLQTKLIKELKDLNKCVKEKNAQILDMKNQIETKGVQVKTHSSNVDLLKQKISQLEQQVQVQNNELKEKQVQIDDKLNKYNLVCDEIHKLWQGNSSQANLQENNLQNQQAMFDDVQVHGWICDLADMITNMKELNNYQREECYQALSLLGNGGENEEDTEEDSLENDQEQICQEMDGNTIDEQSEIKNNTDDYCDEQDEHEQQEFCDLSDTQVSFSNAFNSGNATRNEHATKISFSGLASTVGRKNNQNHFTSLQQRSNKFIQRNARNLKTANDFYRTFGTGNKQSQEVQGPSTSWMQSNSKSARRNTRNNNQTNNTTHETLTRPIASRNQTQTRSNSANPTSRIANYQPQQLEVVFSDGVTSRKQEIYAILKEEINRVIYERQVSKETIVNMKKALQEKDLEMEQVHQDMSSMQQELEMLMQVREQLEKHISDDDQIKQELQEEIDDRGDQMNTLRNQIEEFEKDLMNLQEQMQEVMKLNAEIATSSEHWESQCKNLEGVLIQEREQLTQLMNQNTDKLNSKLKSYKKKLKEKDTQIKDASALLGREIETREAFEAKQKNRVSVECNTDPVLLQLEEENQKLQEEMSKIKGDITAVLDSYDQGQTDKKALSKQFKKLNKAYKTIEQEKVQFEQERQYFVQQMQIAEGISNDLKGKYEESQIQLRVQKKYNEELIEEVKDMQQQLRERNEKLIRLQNLQLQLLNNESQPTIQGKNDHFQKSIETSSEFTQAIMMMAPMTNGDSTPNHNGSIVIEDCLDTSEQFTLRAHGQSLQAPRQQSSCENKRQKHYKQIQNNNSAYLSPLIETFERRNSAAVEGQQRNNKDQYDDLEISRSPTLLTQSMNTSQNLSHNNNKHRNKHNENYNTLNLDRVVPRDLSSFNTTTIDNQNSCDLMVPQSCQNKIKDRESQKHLQMFQQSSMMSTMQRPQTFGTSDSNSNFANQRAYKKQNQNNENENYLVINSSRQQSYSKKLRNSRSRQRRIPDDDDESDEGQTEEKIIDHKQESKKIKKNKYNNIHKLRHTLVENEQ